MTPTDHPIAWENSATRRAWTVHMAMNVAGFIGWIAAWVGLLYVLIVFLSPGFVFLFVLPLGYCFYRAVTQLRYFPPAFRMRRILRTYPWQAMRDAPHGLSGHPDVPDKHHGWFEFPNPARPDQLLALVFSQHLRTEWWHRRMAPRAKPQLKSQISVIWFAGDPRFIGLIAASTHDEDAPRRMQVLEQRTEVVGGQGLADWGATPEDIERGRSVGIYPAHS
ncbi:hypothetical protein [Streptomyces sp. NBC_00576]|uniref:hypothetical protein n=1 Tax=Streptomyces sp. NBC_00576 TaxID=2903665 RepID=UPI002E815307|nr:hypothetical protein [Streptomyces sp. NBC_00576]WUB71371.1 hypothetical protein OG734_15385 [Streptomyces sp. NBC_00576]